LFPRDALGTCFKTANDRHARLSNDDPPFRKIIDSYFAFRADEDLWPQFAEYAFDNFVIRERRSKS